MSRYLVDPELRGPLAAMPSLAPSGDFLPMIREASRRMSELAPASADIDVEFVEREVPTLAGSRIRVLIYRPAGKAGALPAFLHIHGGGYVFGLPEMNDDRNRRLARDLDCVVVSVDYRLAPEVSYPGALEDCYSVLKWMHDCASDLVIDPDRIAIGGESAGGGLAAILALHARDQGEVPVCFQLLIYAMLDDRTGASVDRGAMAGEFIWTPELNRFGWQSLLGEGAQVDERIPHAAAARATDLAGLPATYIAVGALDLFVEENVEFARRLLRVGVPTELHVFPGAYHGFDSLASGAAVTVALESNYFAALRRALHEPVAAVSLDVKSGRPPADRSGVV